jgi:DHA1 family multidrug resistance protein-like MFS transporter
LSSSNAKSLLIFTVFNSIWGIVMGLIGPFYVIFVEKLSGGMEKLGFAFAIMILVQSLVSYYAGRFSDKLGRRPFLFITGYVDATVLFLYTVINTTYQLYLLQAALGVTNAVAGTMKQALLGDLTKRAKRGTDIGKFNAIVGLCSAMGLALGGYAVKVYGIKFIFYFASIVVALSTLLLIFMREAEDDH